MKVYLTHTHLRTELDGLERQDLILHTTPGGVTELLVINTDDDGSERRARLYLSTEQLKDLQLGAADARLSSNDYEGDPSHWTYEKVQRYRASTPAQRQAMVDADREQLRQLRAERWAATQNKKMEK